MSNIWLKLQFPILLVTSFVCLTEAMKTKYGDQTTSLPGSLHSTDALRELKILA